MTAIDAPSLLLEAQLRQCCPPEMHLLDQGESSRQVFFIHQGFVKLVRTQENGREFIAEIYGQGQLVGSWALRSTLPSPVSAITVTKCDLGFLSKERLMKVAVTDPATRDYLADVWEAAHRASLERIVELTCQSTEERLLGFLRGLVDVTDEDSVESTRPKRIRLPLREWEMADYLAVTPAHLSRTLAKLERSGVLRREKGCFMLLCASTMVPGMTY